MACKRDRIVEYLKSIGLEVNVCKNKASGNKGFFKVKSNRYRIDVANNLTETEILHVLVHEFMHYLHFVHDKKLKSLDFMFGQTDELILDELRSLTVELIPKQSAKSLYELKNSAKTEIQKIYEELKSSYIDLKLSKPYKEIERNINKSSYKYLLKYDRVKVWEGFIIKQYSIDNLQDYNLTDNEINYLKLKSKQRMMNRINSRISKLNRYYNSPSELLARAFEVYIFDKDKFKKIAPISFSYIENNIKEQKIPELNKMVEIFILT